MINVIRSTAELHRIQSQLDKAQHYPYGLIEYREKELNEFARCTELLECNQLQIAALGQYSLPDILYSQFYWFTKFMAHYESIYGRDESMRQEQFKIIEAIDRIAAVDGDLLERIEKELGYID